MNFIKHLSINPSIKLWIERSRNALPKPIQEAITQLGTGCTQEGTLIPIPELILWLEPIPLVANEYELSISYLKNIDNEQIPDYADEALKNGKRLTNVRRFCRLLIHRRYLR